MPRRRLRGNCTPYALVGCALILFGASFGIGGCEHALAVVLRCQGRSQCLSASWLWVVTLLLQVPGLALLASGVAEMLVPRWRWRIRFGVRASSSLIALIFATLVVVGATVPVPFLLSFSMVALFSAPSALVILTLLWLAVRRPLWFTSKPALSKARATDADEITRLKPISCLVGWAVCLLGLAWQASGISIDRFWLNYNDIFHFLAMAGIAIFATGVLRRIELEADINWNSEKCGRPASGLYWTLLVVAICISSVASHVALDAEPSGGGSSNASPMAGSLMMDAQAAQLRGQSLPTMTTTPEMTASMDGADARRLGLLGAQLSQLVYSATPPGAREEYRRFPFRAGSVFELLDATRRDSCGQWETLWCHPGHQSPYVPSVMGHLAHRKLDGAHVCAFVGPAARLVFAFRGSWSVDDAATNLAASLYTRKIPASGANAEARVKGAYWDAYASGALAQVRATLALPMYSGHRVLFTGHSLGGAFAVLAAHDAAMSIRLGLLLRQPSSAFDVVTLGKPFVGGAAFAASIQGLLGEGLLGHFRRYVLLTAAQAPDPITIAAAPEELMLLRVNGLNDSQHESQAYGLPCFLGTPAMDVPGRAPVACHGIVEYLTALATLASAPQRLDRTEWQRRKDTTPGLCEAVHRQKAPWIGIHVCNSMNVNLTYPSGLSRTYGTDCKPQSEYASARMLNISTWGLSTTLLLLVLQWTLFGLACAALFNKFVLGRSWRGPYFAGLFGNPDDSIVPSRMQALFHRAGFSTTCPELCFASMTDASVHSVHIPHALAASGFRGRADDPFLRPGKVVEPCRCATCILRPRAQRTPPPAAPAHPAGCACDACPIELAAPESNHPAGCECSACKTPFGFAPVTSRSIQTHGDSCACAECAISESSRVRALQSEAIERATRRRMSSLRLDVVQVVPSMSSNGASAPKSVVAKLFTVMMRSLNHDFDEAQSKTVQVCIYLIGISHLIALTPLLWPTPSAAEVSKHRSDQGTAGDHGLLSLVLPYGLGHVLTGALIRADVASTIYLLPNGVFIFGYLSCSSFVLTLIAQGNAQGSGIARTTLSFMHVTSYTAWVCLCISGLDAEGMSSMGVIYGWLCQSSVVRSTAAAVALCGMLTLPLLWLLLLKTTYRKYRMKLARASVSPTYVLHEGIKHVHDLRLHALSSSASTPKTLRSFANLLLWLGANPSMPLHLPSTLCAACVATVVVVGAFAIQLCIRMPANLAWLAAELGATCAALQELIDNNAAFLQSTLTATAYQRILTMISDVILMVQSMATFGVAGACVGMSLGALMCVNGIFKSFETYGYAYEVFATHGASAIRFPVQRAAHVRFFATFVGYQLGGFVLSIGLGIGLSLLVLLLIVEWSCAVYLRTTLAVSVGLCCVDLLFVRPTMVPLLQQFGGGPLLFAVEMWYCTVSLFVGIMRLTWLVILTISTFATPARCIYPDAYESWDSSHLCFVAYVLQRVEADRAILRATSSI